ncbi:putative membrane protein, partial [Escherichia coli 5.2239]
MSVKP